ncbi:hypothetical protein C8R42DRAFT_682499 [Lentinula raphanica]|nr:hypothetical protein C8R42DRAFT_682499 [Lentinula raphanica]
MVFFLSALALAVSTDSVSYPNEPTKSLSIATSQALVLRADTHPAPNSNTVKVECRLLAQYFDVHKEQRIKETVQRMLNSNVVLRRLRHVLSVPDGEIQAVNMKTFELYYMLHFDPFRKLGHPTPKNHVDYYCSLEFNPPPNNRRRFPRLELWTAFRLGPPSDSDDPVRGALGWNKQASGRHPEEEVLEYWVDYEKGKVNDVDYGYLNQKDPFGMFAHNAHQFLSSVYSLLFERRPKGMAYDEWRIPARADPLASQIRARLECVSDIHSVVGTVETMLNSASVLRHARETFPTQRIDRVTVIDVELNPNFSIEPVVSYPGPPLQPPNPEYHCRIELSYSLPAPQRKTLYATVHNIIDSARSKRPSKGEVGEYIQHPRGGFGHSTWAKFEHGNEVDITKKLGEVYYITDYLEEVDGMERKRFQRVDVQEKKPWWKRLRG